PGNWSMTVPDEVIAMRGRSVILPCSFTFIKKGFKGEIKVIWKKYRQNSRTDFFQCNSNTNANTEKLDCKNVKSNDSRYRLVGDLHKNNISLQIDSVRFKDVTIYFCRVEIPQIQRGAYETQSGTNLRVIAPPSILNLTVTINSSLGYRILRCIVEGEPLPNITWIGPGNAELHKESNNITATPFPEEHQIMSEIHSVIQEGNYTCKAVNNHGHDEKITFIYSFKA
uniref:Ig-like domain-containing protein n=1 Tax=Latimeria chalumnae TaxID=7897 RepID=H2ZVH1_LATCH